MCQFLLHSIETQSYMYIHSFSHIIPHHVLAQEIGYSSLRYTVGQIFFNSKCCSTDKKKKNTVVLHKQLLVEFVYMEEL